jgi:small-conductance mechanosensitive channel
LWASSAAFAAMAKKAPTVKAHKTVIFKTKLHYIIIIIIIIIIIGLIFKHSLRMLYPTLQYRSKSFNINNNFETSVHKMFSMRVISDRLFFSTTGS